MENKDLLKEEKRLEKEKLAAMTAEQRKAYKAEKKAQKKAEAEKAYAEWEKEYDEKNANKAAIIKWFTKNWNKFKFNSPELAKLVYQVVFFLIFSNGVTIWQYLVMLFLPHLFGLELAAVTFQWPAINIAELVPAYVESTGIETYGIIFNELPLLNESKEVIIGGGLGNFIAIEIAVFTAQCINFPLQRNITFKSDGNPVIQAIWYFIGWVAISILVNATWGFIGPVFEKLITADPVINNLLKTFVTGGLSMFVFFFIFKIIFPEKKEETETVAE